MTMTRWCLLLVVLAFLALVGVACGEDSLQPESDAGGPEPEAVWTGQVLEAVPGADSAVLLAAGGDQMTLTMTTDDGAIQGFAADDDGRFEAGRPLSTGVTYLSLGGVARLGPAWFTLGSGGLSKDGEELQFAVRAFTSTDGRTWSAIESVGLEGPADVEGLVSVGDDMVAVGSLRTAQDPAVGGFRPVAWHSADGVQWTAVALPLAGAGDGFVGAVAVVDDEVLAVGAAGQRGALWSSTDAGSTWSLEERAGIPDAASLDSLAVEGSTVVLSGTPAYRGEEFEASGEAVRLLLRSVDGGQTWSEAGQPPPAAGIEASYGTSVTTGGEQFFTVSSSYVTSFDDPERCYADLELCQQDSAQTLYASPDGDVWSRIDTSGIGVGEAGEVWTVVGAGDGRLVAMTAMAGGVGTWTWPAGAPLPTEPEPTDPTTNVVVLGEEDEMEPGVTYGVPLYIHCGMEWLFVGGEAWERIDGGPDTETGAGDSIDPSWPVAQQTLFGFATLGPDGQIEYSIGDGEVIATYALTEASPPGCD
ncbi:MAG: hypothetical protein ABWZ90_10040 [Acidimicrobiales bacterium]